MLSSDSVKLERTTNDTGNIVKDKKTPQTDKLTISVAGDDFNVGGKKKRLVRAKSTEETTTSLETWFENVVSPVEAA